MVMFDFICMGSADLFEMERERKIYVSSGIRTHAHDTGKSAL